MKNYKECSITELEAAMKTRWVIKYSAEKPEDVPTAQLFIIYTKSNAEFLHLSGTGGAYVIGLRHSARNMRDAIGAELKRRNVLPTEGA
jgi:hypothetical protein